MQITPAVLARLAAADADVAAGRVQDMDAAYFERLRERVGEGVARAEAWRRENAAALESSNAWVEANGLPLARCRMTDE